MKAARPAPRRPVGRVPRASRAATDAAQWLSTWTAANGRDHVPIAADIVERYQTARAWRDAAQLEDVANELDEIDRHVRKLIPPAGKEPAWTDAGKNSARQRFLSEGLAKRTVNGESVWVAEPRTVAAHIVQIRALLMMLRKRTQERARFARGGRAVNTTGGPTPREAIALEVAIKQLHRRWHFGRTGEDRETALDFVAAALTLAGEVGFNTFTDGKKKIRTRLGT